MNRLLALLVALSSLNTGCIKGCIPDVEAKRTGLGRATVYSLLDMVVPPDLTSGVTGPPTFVQKAEQYLNPATQGGSPYDNFGPLTASITYTAGNSAVVIVGVHRGDLTPLASLSDGTNTYTLQDELSEVGGLGYLAIYGATNLAGGARTVTATGDQVGGEFANAANKGGVLIVLEYSGVNVSSLYGHHMQADGGSYYNIVSGTISAPAGGRLVGAAFSTEYKTVSAVAGYTFRSNPTAWFAAVEYDTVTSATNYDMALASVSNSYWLGGGVALAGP